MLCQVKILPPDQGPKLRDKLELQSAGTKQQDKNVKQLDKQSPQLSSNHCS